MTLSDGSPSLSVSVVILSTGNYVYIADYSCVRIYDIERKKVATLAGACGRLEEPTTSVSPPVFSGNDQDYQYACRPLSLLSPKMCNLLLFCRLSS